jgi:hypothetical protein
LQWQRGEEAKAEEAGEEDGEEEGFWSRWEAVRD